MNKNCTSYQIEENNGWKKKTMDRRRKQWMEEENNGWKKKTMDF